MSVPARIHIVTLGVADLGRSVAFYRSLGWEPASSSSGEIAWFRTGGCHLGLFEYGALARDASLPEARRNGFGGVTLAMCVASEEGVTATLDAASAAGATILKPGQRADWGGFSGYFADPDGYPWEVAHNPFFQLDEEGNLHIP